MEKSNSAQFEETPEFENLRGAMGEILAVLKEELERREGEWKRKRSRLQDNRKKQYKKKQG